MTTEAPATYCGSCGGPLKETSRFCPRCGATAGTPADPFAAKPKAPGGVRFANNTFRAMLTSLAILLVAVSAIAMLDSLRSQLSILDRLEDARAGNITLAEANVLLSDTKHSDSRLQTTNLIEICALLLSGVVFLFWLHRTSKNLRALSVADLKRSPGWSVASFIIPIVNFWLPLLVMREIWRASGPEAVDSQTTGANWRRTPVPALIGLWWLLWLASGFGSRLLYVLKPSVNSAQDAAALRTYDHYVIASLLLLVVTSAIAIVVVQLVTARQREAFTHQSSAISHQSEAGVG